MAALVVVGGPFPLPGHQGMDTLPARLGVDYMQTEDIAIAATPDHSTAQTATIIADQNDRFRKAAFGIAVPGDIPTGQILMTAGVSGQPDAFRAALFEAIVTYDDFNTDCDPHGWHEMGVMEIDGQTVWFKFDLYDENYEYGSSDPTELRFTRRVLTILLPSEY
jgi:hypothetical protein